MSSSITRKGIIYRGYVIVSYGGMMFAVMAVDGAHLDTVNNLNDAYNLIDNYVVGSVR